MLRLQLKTSFFDRDIDVNFVSQWETSDPRLETEIRREPQGNQVTAIKTGRWTRFRFPRLPSLLSLFSHNPEKHEDHHDLPVLFKISDLKILIARSSATPLAFRSISKPKKIIINGIIAYIIISIPL